MVTLVLVIGYTVFIFVNLEISMLLKWKKAAVRGAALGLVGMLAACGGGGGGDGTFRQEAEIEFVATPSRIALNTQGVDIEDTANRSPFLSTITVTPKLNGDYQLVDIHVQEVGVDPSKGSLYTLSVDEMVACNTEDTAKNCHGAFQSFTVKAGNSQIFYFSSGFRSGEITLRASAVIKGRDGDIPVTKDIKLTIDGGGAGNGIPDHFSALKGSSDLSPSASYDYTLEMQDAGNHFVPGSDKHNSMQIEIAEDLAFVRGARLIGNAANGVSNTGRSIMLPTKSNGVGYFSFVSPNQDMSVNLRVMADRADNNIDNGIADPLVQTLKLVIVDKGVARLTFAGPLANGVRTYVNNLPISNGDSYDGSSGVYGRLVTVVASDSKGNPAGSGLRVRFRLIDGPQEGYGILGKGRGSFIFEGVKGNPMGEGDKIANFFSAEDGINMTSNYANANIGGAAGFAGCQLVYGNGINAVYDNPGAVSGIRETYAPFERGAKGIATLTPCPSPSVCQSATATTPAVRWSANLTENINSKFDTGYSVPWVIGCGAPVGNVADNVAVLDAQGHASTRLSYPTTYLGRHFILVAEVERADGRKVGSLMKHWYLADLRDKGFTLTNAGDATISVRGGSASGVGQVNIHDQAGTPYILPTALDIRLVLEENALLKEAEKSLEDAQADLAAASADITTRTAALTAAEAKLTAAEAALATAETALTTAETQFTSANCATPPVAGTPASCTQAIIDAVTAAKSKVTSEQTKVATAQTAVDTAQKNLLDAESQKNTAQAEINKFKAQVTKYTCAPTLTTNPNPAVAWSSFGINIANACEGTKGSIFMTILEPSNTIEVKVQ